MVLPPGLDGVAVAIGAVRAAVTELTNEAPGVTRHAPPPDLTPGGWCALGRALDWHAATMQEALSAFRTRALLLAAAVHDAKGPLSVVAGYGQILRTHPELDSEAAAKMLDAMTGAVQRLDDLLVDLARINQWLDSAAGDEGFPTDLTALFDRLASRALGTAHPYAIEVSGEGVVTVDAARLARIVENLLVNVTRHTPPGTPVWIRADVGAREILIGVDDDGPGIPGALQHRLFQTRPRSGEASGVGLTIVRVLTESLGGRAWVVSRRGGGAAFRVWVPIGTGSSPTPGQSAPVSSVAAAAE